MLMKGKLVRLDIAGAISARENASEIGCAKENRAEVDGAEVNNSGASNETSDSDGPGAAKFVMQIL